ncbi:MAG: NAD(P)/FAD-dependent oxidoreductase [Candidatus Thermoplasmatota archaeon]
MKDVAVIGGGPTGLAAALELYKKGFEVVVIERDDELGGLLDQCIHDGFGTKLFNEGLSGPEFASRFIEKLENSDIEILLEAYVKDVDVSQEVKTIKCVTPKGIREVQSKAIVYAIGCRERNQYEINIGGTRPSGVFTAGTIQRLVNLYGILPGENAVIVGGGDVGMIVARHLFLEGCKNILMVYPEQFFTGLPRNVQQCILDYDIPYQPRTVVKRIIGRNHVEKVELVKVDKQWKPVENTGKIVECASLILSVGLIPYSEKLEDLGAAIDEKTGGPIINECFETTVDGVFAVGNLLQIFDYVDDAVETAFKAAEGVEKYLKTTKPVRDQFIPLNAGENINCLTPQRIEKCNQEITVFFRPCITSKKPVIALKNREKQVLKKFKKPFVRPSTLENITISIDVFENQEEVSLHIQEE